jgi:hypothetical protein
VQQVKLLFTLGSSNKINTVLIVATTLAAINRFCAAALKNKISFTKSSAKVS